MTNNHIKFFEFWGINLFQFNLKFQEGNGIYTKLRKTTRNLTWSHYYVSLKIISRNNAYCNRSRYFFKEQQKYTLFTSSYVQKMSKDEKLMLSVNNKLWKNN